MSEDVFLDFLLDEIINYYSKETDEWDDPTGDTAVYLVEKTSPKIEGGDEYAKLSCNGM